MYRDLLVFVIILVLLIGGLITILFGIVLWNTTIILSGCLGFLLGLFIEIKFNYNYKENIMEETNGFEPFDIVIYKPTGERGLVKRVTDSGVFVLFRIQSTAQLCKPEDLELE